MKITTWNVNSLKVRLPHVLEWLQANPVDALALQETKLTDENFPREAIEEAGYSVAFNGQKTYNGVAIISPHAVDDIKCDIPNYRDEQKRVIAATVHGVRLICCYVPNGQALDSDKYSYKLGWLDALHAYVADELKRHEKLVVLGDFNIVPRPEDSHNPDKWEGNIFCSPPERERFQALLGLGLTDSWTLFGERKDKARFTWWDYRGGSFHKNLGLRIDHVLTTATLTKSCTDCNGDVRARYGQQRSDHIPVTAVFED